MTKRGLLFIMSGPAGSGKGTLVKRVRELAEFDFSVSATTRGPRPGEIDGVHYFFVKKEEFEKKIAAGEMLEYAEYVGNYYGTPKQPVERTLAAGKNIILDIDVQGAIQVKEKMPEAVMIFVLPPDFATLMRRIRGRGTESPEIIEKRMQKARLELESFSLYDYVVVNRDNDIESAARDVLSILKAETLKTFRNREIKDNFFL